MPVFSKLSIERLGTCTYALQAVLKAVIQRIDFIVLEGFRGREAQAEAFKDGKSKLQFPKSKHNKFPSQAVDIAPYYPTIPHVRWGALQEYKQLNAEEAAKYPTIADYKAACFMAFAQLAREVLGTAAQMDVKLIWGGDWNGNGKTEDERFVDMPHFEVKK